jgi:hypothetical protein
VLAVTFPWSILLADASSGLLRSSGTVDVNGKVAPAAVALFAGDKIATASQGVATIMVSGSILTLSPGSSLIYGTNRVEMGCGQLAVTALQRGLTAKVRNLQITPGDEDSTYDISHANGKLTVGVRSGSAIVDDGQQKIANPFSHFGRREMHSTMERSELPGAEGQKWHALSGCCRDRCSGIPTVCE